MRGAGADAPEAERYRVEAVARTARLLQALALEERAGAKTLARACGLTPDFVRRALSSLERSGLASLDEDGETWRLGLAWLRLADAKRRQTDLAALALPIMRAMREAVDETVSVSASRGTRRVVVASLESRQPVRRVAHTGFETALHTGASGRALLLGLSPHEREAYFDRVVNETPDFERARYMADLDAATQTGFVKVEDEVTRGMAALAAPVRDHDGAVVASLTISTPRDRLTPALERAAAAALLRGARDLSRQLGQPDEASNPGET